MVHAQLKPLSIFARPQTSIDYSLVGIGADQAIENGLAEAD